MVTDFGIIDGQITILDIFYLVKRFFVATDFEKILFPMCYDGKYIK
jgi:hypothetical protein